MLVAEDACASILGPPKKKKNNSFFWKKRKKHATAVYAARTCRFNTQFSLYRFIINNRSAEVYAEVYDSVYEGVDPQLYSGKHKIVVIKKLDFLF